LIFAHKKNPTSRRESLQPSNIFDETSVAQHEDIPCSPFHTEQLSIKDSFMETLNKS